MRTRIRESRIIQWLFLTAVTVFVLLVALVLWRALIAGAGEPQNATGRIWLTREGCADESGDVSEYVPGEWVWINGAEFTPGSYAWSIAGQPGEASCDPEEIVASGTLSATEQGGFCFPAYRLNTDGDEDCGEYTVHVDGATEDDSYTVSEGTEPWVEVWADCGNIYARGSSGDARDWDLTISGTDTNGEAVNIRQSGSGTSGSMTFSRTDPGTYGPHSVEVTATLTAGDDSVMAYYDSNLTCGPPTGSLTLEVDCVEAHFTGSTEVETNVDYTLSDGQVGSRPVGNGAFSFDVPWDPVIEGQYGPWVVSAAATLRLADCGGADVTSEISRTLTCADQPSDEASPATEDPAEPSEESVSPPYTWDPYYPYCIPPYCPAQWYAAPQYWYPSFSYWWAIPAWSWYWGPYLTPGW